MNRIKSQNLIKFLMYKNYLNNLILRILYFFRSVLGYYWTDKDQENYDQYLKYVALFKDL